MFLAILFIRTSADYLVSWDKNLDPLEIFWPNSWFDNLVSLSSNHAGTKNATVIINCNVEVDLPVGTYIEVTLPGFGAFPYTYSIILNAMQPSIFDNVFTFSSVTMPEIAGAYGPISLIIMQGSTGQTIASSVTFSYVGVTTALPSPTPGMTVEFSTWSPKVVSEITTLNFTIPLSTNLQKYDYLIIFIDPIFGTGVLNSPIWNSSTILTEALFSKTAFTYTSHVYNADGSISAQGNFMIYGLQQSVTNPQTLIFSVSGFINPKYVAHVSTWEARFIRWGTSTVLQRFTGTGPSATAGIVSGTWVPTNRYLTSRQITSKAVIYMTLSFVTQHAVPKSGTIQITFNNATIATSNIGSDASQALSSFAVTDTSPVFLDYYPTSGLTCSIVQGVVCNVSPKEDLAQGTNITIYNIVTFGTDTATVDIITKTGSFIIDSKLRVVSQSLDEFSDIMSKEPKFQFINNKRTSFTADNAINIINMNGHEITIIADIEIYTFFIQDLTVNLKFPFAISPNANDNLVSLTTGAYMYGSISNEPATTFAISTDFTNSTVGTNSISIKLPVSPGNRLSMQIAAGSSSSAARLFLPFWASSRGTRYEVLISYTPFFDEYFSKPISFAPSTINSLTAKAACVTAGVPLMPIEISIASPFDYTPPSGYLAYFDFAVVISAAHSSSGTIGSNFGTGLESGAVYPSSLSSGRIFLSTADTGHLLYTPEAPLTTNTLSFVVPLTGLATSATLKIGVTLYANRTIDGSRFIIALIQPTTKITAGTVVERNPDLLNSPKNITARTAATTFTMESVGSIYSGTVLTTAIFILEQGWTFASDATLKVGSDLKAATASSTLTILTSADPAWKWSIGYKKGYSYTSSTEGNQAQLSSATAPWYSKTNSLLYFIASKAGGDFETTSNDACHIFAVGKIPVTNAILQPINYSPLTSKDFGVDVQTVNLQISLNTPAVVSVGSIFTATIGPDFVSEGCSCQIVAGPFSQTTKVIGSICASTMHLLHQPLASSSIVSIIVFGVMVPRVNAPGTIKAGFTSVTVTSSASTYPASSVYMEFNDERDGANEKTRTTFSWSSTIPGKSTIIKLKVIPNNTGAKAVHLQIIFKLSVLIPNGSNLTFTGESFLEDSYTRYTCWLSVGYSAVVVKGTSITFTLNQAIEAGTIVEMRKDKAFNIPSSAAAVWLISAVFGDSLNNLITDYSSTNTLLNKLTYATAPTASITEPTLTTSISNMYFESIHTFKFVANVKISKTDLIVFEAPLEYDAHVGRSHIFTEIVSSNWLTCKSSISSDLSCRVEHWYITCSGITSNAANEIIDVQLWLYNPGASLVSWNVYVMSSSFELLANGAYGVTSSFTPLPAPNIDLYNITHQASSLNSYFHRIFVKLSDYHPVGSLIAVKFPYIYALQKYNSEIVSCAAWFNTTTENFTITAPVSNCEVYGNSVVFNISNPALAKFLVIFQMNDIIMPASGLTRAAGADVMSKLFTNYDFWSTKFMVYSYTKSTLNTDTVLYMSYDNLNAGYTGFFKNEQTESEILMNKGYPINVIPGTFSMEYSITTKRGFIDAYNLTLIPDSTYSNNFKFNAASYTITNEHPEAWFRVGLPLNSASGYYYINWTIIEAPLFRYEYNYQAKPTTKVIVIKKSLKISVSSILPVSIFYGSFPIAVSLADGVSPFSNIFIGLSISESSTVFNFTPASLSFGPGESVKYFRINITGNVANGQSYNVNLTLGGSDAAAYSPAFQLVRFTIGSLYTTSAETKAYLTSTTKTNAVLSLDTNSYGIATWTVYSTSLGNEFSNYDLLVSIAPPLIGTPNENQTTVDQQVEAWNLMVSAIDQSDWEDYSITILILSEFIFYCGQQFVARGSGQVLASFSNLIAFTSYTGAVWLDNFSGQNMTFASANATTAVLDDPIQINLVLANTFDSYYQDLIGLSVSQSLLIQASRVIEYGSLTNNRQLSTKASYLLLPSLISSTTTKDTIKKLNSDTLLYNLRANNVLTNSQIAFTTSQLTQDSFGTQSLLEVYWNLTDPAKPNILFTVENDGFACCAYQVNDTTPLTSFQIYSGQNENGDNIDEQKICADVKKGKEYYFTWEFYEGVPYGNYTFSFTVCNAYPILPSCIDDALVQTFEWANVYGLASSILVELFTFLAYLA